MQKDVWNASGKPLPASLKPPATAEVKIDAKTLVTYNNPELVK